MKESNDHMQLHSVFEALYQVREGASWTEELTAQLDSFVHRIAQGLGLDGECNGQSDEECIEVECTEMDEAINTLPSFIEWSRAKSLYDFFPRRQRDSADYDEDFEGFQKPNESDLSFAQRSINVLREGDSHFSNHHESDTTVLQLVQLRKGEKSVSFWIASSPGRDGNYSRCLPRGFPDVASARSGLREFGFRNVDELNVDDLSRLGFPREK
jgi:hypothetical protein